MKMNYFTFSKLDKQNIINCFTYKPYNFKDIPTTDSEYKKLELDLGNKFDKIIKGKQEHTNVVKIVTEDNIDEEFIGVDGLITNLKNVALVSNILPESLSKYFFFDGERIDRLAQIDGRSEIKKAILDILGLTTLEKLEDAFSEIAKEFQSCIINSCTFQLFLPKFIRHFQSHAIVLQNFLLNMLSSQKLLPQLVSQLQSCRLPVLL